MAAPRSNDNGDATVMDPLLEQMSSLLRLGSRPIAALQEAKRSRRFSDADRAPASALIAKLEPFAVRSQDGSRWLPTPDEQTHRYGSMADTAPEAQLEPNIENQVEPHMCTTAGCAVAKVFQTTELLELISSFLGTKDIWTHRLTSPRWNATFNASPELRLHFFYYPQFTRPALNFQLLPLSIPGLMIERGEPLHLGQWITVDMTQDAACAISPQSNPYRRVRSRSIFEGMRGGLGPKAGQYTDMWPGRTPTPRIKKQSALKYSDLFITQPPVLGMQAFIVPPPEISAGPVPDDWEGEGSEVELGACAKLSCDSGITLGFLAETAESLLGSRKHTGDVARVIFKAIVSFTRSEPAPRKRGIARSVTRIG